MNFHCKDMKNLSTGQIFPIKNLPISIKNFAENIAEVYGVPVEFPAMSIISAIGTALGNRVKLTTNHYTNFPQLWVVIVAPSGVGKSEPLRIAYAPIHERERKEHILFKEHLSEWKRLSVEAKQNDKQTPEKPKQKRMLCSDTTPEALFSLLAENQALTICRDELAGHFQDFGRYNKSGEVAHHLSSFDNNDFSVDRKGEENAMMIFKPVLSMVGTIQPNVLQEVAKKEHLRGNGYFQRCLFVYPENIQRPNYSERSLNPAYVETHKTFIDECLDLSANTEFTLCSQANEWFISFANEITEKVNTTENDYLKSLYSKMEIHVLRLALILAVAESAKNIVPASAMRDAIDLCRYFMMTGEKVYQPEEKKYSKNEIYVLTEKHIGIKNVKQYAESLGVGRTKVQDAIAKLPTRIASNDTGALLTAIVKNQKRKLDEMISFREIVIEGTQGQGTSEENTEMTSNAEDLECPPVKNRHSQ